MKVVRDVVIVAYGRSPIGKAVRGSLATEHPSKVASEVLVAVLKKVQKLPWEKIDDVIVGAGMPEDVMGLNFARAVSQHANIPDCVPAHTITRLSASGLQSIILGANAIMSGENDIVVAGGVDYMSMLDIDTASADPYVVERADELLSMGRMSEVLADKMGYSREAIDSYAVKSHQKAAAAQKQGKFNKEIVPVSYTDKEGKQQIFSKDEIVNASLSQDVLAKLPSPYAKTGKVTEGNSAQTADGAAFVVLMSSRKAKKFGIKPIATILGSLVTAEDQAAQNIGPIKSISKLMERLKLTAKKFDVMELNEVYAPQAMLMIDKIGADPTKVNPRGGAIALGHPRGATGTIMMVKALSYLEDTKGKYGLISTHCEGGMIASSIIKRG
ncbi:MAG: thiolase family protein [Spirochaetota bacterium]